LRTVEGLLEPVQVDVRQQRRNHASNNVANTVVIETMIDRARLRPIRGADWRPGGI
jgi:hypothetical protein